MTQEIFLKLFPHQAASVFQYKCLFTLVSIKSEHSTVVAASHLECFHKAATCPSSALHTDRCSLLVGEKTVLPSLEESEFAVIWCLVADRQMAELFCKADVARAIKLQSLEYKTLATYSSSSMCAPLMLLKPLNPKAPGYASVLFPEGSFSSIPSLHHMGEQEAVRFGSKPRGQAPKQPQYLDTGAPCLRAQDPKAQPTDFPTLSLVKKLSSYFPSSSLRLEASDPHSCEWYPLPLAFHCHVPHSSITEKWDLKYFLIGSCVRDAPRHSLSW